MAAIAIPYLAAKRTVGRFPELTMQNFIVERTETQIERPLALIGRAGLKPFVTVGQGPVRGLYQKAGLFNDDALIVSGTQVFRVAQNGQVTTLTGSVAGRGRVRIDMGRDADANDIARIATGEGLYLVSGNTVTEEDFPDNTRPGCQDILEFRSFWIAIRTGSDLVYYLVPGSTTWTALDYASAEYQPDKLEALESRGQGLWFLGTDSTEVFGLTGDGNDPIAPIGGMAYDAGCRARDTAVNIAGVLFWVDQRCNVMMSTGGAPESISSSALAEQIRLSPAEDLRAWGYGRDGHVFYVLTTGDATWVFDASSERWGRFSSKGYTYWRAHLGSDVGGFVIASDALQGSNKVWKLEPGRNTDEDDEIVRRFTAMIEVPEGALSLGNVVVNMALGYSPRTGQGSSPLVGMRYSDDGTATWSGWQWASPGITGARKGQVRWNRLGQVRPPNRFLEFTCSDPIEVRVSDVRGNVP